MGGIFIIQKLIDAISNQIYSIFNKPNIYVEHIKQGFLLPCFCVRCIKTQEQRHLSNRYKIFNKIEITYFPKKNYNTNDDFNNILNILYDKLIMLKFEKGFIKGENMEGYIENGAIKFFVEYNFYVFKKEETDKMQKLYI
ncbi:DUF6838 family protein [uncultured Tyzzerella sp.]|uniref:phage tail terminator family protein n=1 Tax=uncultured Tyzzerella sp. TaxID=2321398 RepID=UPI0029432BAA|nr:hypothetical protein [uncultured Tyzzerella sp.]